MALLAAAWAIGLPFSSTAGHLDGAPQPGNATGEDPEDPRDCPPDEDNGEVSDGNNPDGVSGAPAQNPTCGDPVSLYTGRFLYAQTDLRVDGVVPITMTRYYDSRSRYDSPLGYGWTHPYDMRVFEYPDDKVVVRTGVGRRDVYDAVDPIGSPGEYVLSDPLSGRAGELVGNGDGTYTLTLPDRRVATFDAEGRLETLADPQGNQLEMIYAPDNDPGATPIKYKLLGTSPFTVQPEEPLVVAYVYQLEWIQERLADGTLSGRTLDLDYDAVTGRLIQITSHDGRVVDYDHAAYEATPGMPSTLTTLGNLEGVTGLASSVNDAAHRVVSTYGYNDGTNNHLLTDVQDGANREPTVNVYAAGGVVVEQTVGDTVWTFTYDNAASPIERTVTRTIVNELGVPQTPAVTTFKLGPQGHLVEKIDALGNKLEYTRDANNYIDHVIVSATDGGAPPMFTVEKDVDLDYDAEGRLLTRSVTLAGGETVTETWTYDHDWVASYQRVSSAAPETFLQSYTYLRASPGDPPENIETFTQRVSATQSETTTFGYDPLNGRLRTITPPDDGSGDGLQIVREYYPSGHQHAGLLEEIHIETNDGSGPIIDPHLTRNFSYNAQGLVASVTDARGNITSFSYDERGQLIQLTQPFRDESQMPAVDTTVSTFFTYSGPNSVAPSTDDPATWPAGTLLTRIERGRIAGGAEGQVQHLLYDDRGRLVEVKRKNDLGSFESFATFAYDSDGNRKTATDGELRTTEFAYNELRRLISVKDAANNVTQFAYDVAGNRTLVKDALLRDTVFSYDALNRLISVDQQAESLVTAFDYDAAGNVEVVTDPKTQDTTYTYDEASRLTSVSQNLGGAPVSYQYDTRGRLFRVINARGNVLQYVYEPWGGLERVDHYPDVATADAGSPPDRTVRYAYDAAGNLRSTSDATILATGELASGAELLADRFYSFSYDAQNRVDTTTVHYLFGDSDVVLDNAYDAFGNRSNLNVTDKTGSFDHSWTFNQINRLESAALPGDPTPGDPTLQFLYWDNDDLMQITHGNAATTDYTYHPEGPVDTITVNHSVPGVLHVLDYGVDVVLNIDALSETRGTDPVESYIYGYDPVSRLASANYPAAFGLPGDEDFAYDDAGNRDNLNSPGDFTYDGNNRIVQSIIAGTLRSYAFDADGNLDKITDGQPTPTTLLDLVFDETNRLSRSTAGTNPEDQYFYDPFGRRIFRTGGGVAPFFVWDGDQLLGEYSFSSGARLVRYAYAGGFAPVQVAYNDQAGGEDIYDVHTDHLDTPKMLTDDSGAVVWRAAHTAYGKAVLDPGNTLAEDFNIRFPGQYYDKQTEQWDPTLNGGAGGSVEGTGLHYNRFRYYDPEIGRYVNADPIGQFGVLLQYRVTVEMAISAWLTANISDFDWATPSNVVPVPGDILRNHLYTYVENQPLAKTDAFGLQSQEMPRPDNGALEKSCIAKCERDFEPGSPECDSCQTRCMGSRVANFSEIATGLVPQSPSAGLFSALVSFFTGSDDE